MSSLGVPAGGTCDGKPCWRATKTGFRYRDPNAASDGIRQIVLKAGAAGRSKIQVRGQGTKLVLPTLPFAQASKVTVQLRNGGAHTVGAPRTARPARRNQADQFKDRGDLAPEVPANPGRFSALRGGGDETGYFVAGIVPASRSPLLWSKTAAIARSLPLAVNTHETGVLAGGVTWQLACGASAPSAH